MLTRDLLSESISPELLASLEREVPPPTAAETAEPKPKRQRLDVDGDSSSTLSLEDKVTLCAAFKNVVMGNPPHPRLWSKLGSAGSKVDFILQVGL